MKQVARILCMLLFVAALSGGLTFTYSTSLAASGQLYFPRQPDLSPPPPPRYTVREAAVRRERRVALTFDDGPFDGTTDALLDGLAQRDIRCTFFLLGSRVRGRERILRRIADEGHLIANHSYSHSLFTKLTAAQVAGEVADTADLIEQACGVRPRLVRPPYGGHSPRVREAIGGPAILWSVDPNDWQLRNAERIAQAVIDKARDGDIILLHDAYQSSVDAALTIIDTLTEQGFDFVTVEQLYAECGTELQDAKTYYSAPKRPRVPAQVVVGGRPDAGHPQAAQPGAQPNSIPEVQPEPADASPAGSGLLGPDNPPSSPITESSPDAGASQFPSDLIPPEAERQNPEESPDTPSGTGVRRRLSAPALRVQTPPGPPVPMIRSGGSLHESFTRAPL